MEDTSLRDEAILSKYTAGADGHWLKQFRQVPRHTRGQRMASGSVPRRNLLPQTKSEIQ